MIQARAMLLVALAGITLVPTITIGPAGTEATPYLTNAHLTLIYWGAAWDRTSTRPSRDAITAALHDIISGPWGSQLSQYHHIGPSSIDQVVTDGATDPPSPLTDRDLKTFLEARINRHQVATPTRRVQRIYTVLLPAGIVASDPSLTGQHLNYYRDDGAPVYLAWVLNDGTLTGANSIPKMFSHELAETLTDADVSTGGHGITFGRPHDEIADVCNHLYATVNGHAEQAYWSMADGQCVLPRSALAGHARPKRPEPVGTRRARLRHWVQPVARSGPAVVVGTTLPTWPTGWACLAAATHPYGDITP